MNSYGITKSRSLVWISKFNYNILSWQKVNKKTRGFFLNSTTVSINEIVLIYSNFKRGITIKQQLTRVRRKLDDKIKWTNDVIEKRLCHQCTWILVEIMKKRTFVPSSWQRQRPIGGKDGAVKGRGAKGLFFTVNVQRGRVLGSARPIGDDARVRAGKVRGRGLDEQHGKLAAHFVDGHATG